MSTTATLARVRSAVSRALVAAFQLGDLHVVL
jgi:hypothetical protein